MAKKGVESVTLRNLQRAGFPMGAENLAIDLADTLVTVGDPEIDLLAAPGANERFWRLHAAWLPGEWSTPDLDRTRELRGAIRRIFDGVIRGEAVAAADLGVINASAAGAPVTYEVIQADEAFMAVERWHGRDSATLALAAVARSAIEVLAQPAKRRALRRCANSTCSMLFVNGDARRRWCTPNICGNRDRAARHYKRHRASRR